MNIFWIIHFIIFLYVLFGWLVLPSWTLKYQILLVPIILLDWNDYDGQCILTRLEYYYKTGQWKQKTPLQGGPVFFKPILEKILGKKVDLYIAERMNYVILLLAWFITYYKFIKYHKIKY